MNKEFTPEKLMEIKSLMKQAEQDDTPFPIVEENGNISVIGDATKTAPKINDYTIKFRYTKEEYTKEFGETIPEECQVIGDFVLFYVTYKNVTLKPVDDIAMARSLMKLIPFFYSITTEGEIKEIDNAEFTESILSAEKEIHISMYDFVADFLQIDNEMRWHMMSGSVISSLGYILKAHPELINEAQAFLE